MQEQDCREPDRKDEASPGNEEKRAAVYGLGVKDLHDVPLIIPPGKHVRLEPERGAGEPGYARLEPKSIDDVKRWIGVPDEIGAKRCGCHMLPPEVPGVASAGELRKLDTTTQRAIRDIANEYVNGDSRRVLAYKPLLAHLIDRAYIVGVFLRQDIDIYNGSVLEIGKSVKILFARHIRIWRGGLLKISGNAKIDCVSINGDITGVFQAIDKIAIGRLMN